MMMRNIFRPRTSSKLGPQQPGLPLLTDDICEIILTQLFSYVLASPDIFYFVKHPTVRKEVLKIRTVCKQWNEVIKRVLPMKKHLKIEKSCCNNEPAKGKILETNVTDSLFVNGFSNSLVLHLCVSHFTLELSEKFGPKITHMYLQSVDGIAGFLPRIVKNTRNLKTLVLSDCYWIGRLAISSHSLAHFTLYKVVGLEMLQLKCPNLSSLCYNECNLSPLLSCENHLKIISNSTVHLKIQITALYIEHIELSLEKTKSSSLEIINCCGNKIRVRSKDLQGLVFTNTKYGKIMTSCPRLKTFQIEGVKVLKRLVLDSTTLARVQLGRCVVRSLTCDSSIMPQARVVSA